jgi:hypothetical protein
MPTRLQVELPVYAFICQISRRRIGSAGAPSFARPDKGTQYVPVERAHGTAIDGLHFGVVRYNAVIGLNGAEHYEFEIDVDRRARRSAKQD